MAKSRRIKFDDFDFATPPSLIKTFYTKKEAQNAASAIGWSQEDIIQMQKRFEAVWIVAQWFIGGEGLYGFTFDAFAYPLFEWERSQFGIIKMKTAKAVARTARR